MMTASGACTYPETCKPSDVFGAYDTQRWAVYFMCDQWYLEKFHRMSKHSGRRIHHGHQR